MITLRVIASGSGGNCYVLDNGTAPLVLECGAAPAKVAAALGFRRPCAALVTHEHGDHAAHAGKFADSGMPVYASAGTIDALKRERGRRWMLKPKALSEAREVKIHDWRVLPFGVKHDAAEPLGFMITHPDMGTLLFATDTYYLPFVFRNLSHIMIECNYTLPALESNIEAGLIAPGRRARTVESHMSLETCIESLRANDLSQVRNIVLLHLSSVNADAAAFRAAVSEATAKPVYVAEPGLVLDFGRTPF